MEQAHPTALLVNQEIAAVVTAMRQNSKWALVANRYSDRVNVGSARVAEVSLQPFAKLACDTGRRSWR